MNVNDNTDIESKNRISNIYFNEDGKYTYLKYLTYIIGFFSILLYYPINKVFSGEWQVKQYFSLFNFSNLRNDTYFGKDIIVSGVEFLSSNGFEWVGLRYYSLMLIVGAIVAFYFIKTFSNNIYTKDGLKIDIDSLFLNSIILGVIGSRLLYVAINYGYYFEKPIEIINFQAGGFSFYGGLALVGLYLLYHTRKHKIHLLKLVDTLVPSILIFQIFARFGNFFNYESYGLPTSSKWGMYVPEGAIINNRYNIANISDRFYHPTFLYEVICNILVLLLAVFLLSKLSFEKLNKDDNYSFGLVTAIYLIGYGSGRFFIEYLRLDVTPITNYLTLGQILSITLVVIGLIIFFKKHRQKRSSGDYIAK